MTTKTTTTKRKLTLTRVMAAIERDDYTGFCIACGAKADGCEPDARGYKCQVCGEHKVYGAEEVLFIIGGWTR